MRETFLRNFVGAMLQYEEVQEDGAGSRRGFPLCHVVILNLLRPNLLSLFCFYFLGDTHGYHDDSDMQESMFDFDEATGQFFESNTSSSVHHEPPLYPDAKYAGGNNYDNYDNGEDYENEYYENDAAYEGELCRTSFYTNRSKLLNAGKV